jgi:hypothetical protein
MGFDKYSQRRFKGDPGPVDVCPEAERNPQLKARNANSARYSKAVLALRMGASSELDFQKNGTALERGAIELKACALPETVEGFL